MQALSTSDTLSLALGFTGLGFTALNVYVTRNHSMQSGAYFT